MEQVVEGEIWEGGGKRYHMEKVVGNGAFGIVWRGRDEGGTLVAIKKVILDRRYHNRELEMMKQLEHECVIKLLNFFEKPGRKRDETYLHLVMDFLPETIRSVALQYHKQRLRFPTDHVRVYLYQALRALEYVHSRRICHRDLKPDNFLVDPMRLTLKLIDFGCAKVLVKGQPNVSYICSRYYRAPELLFGATEYTCSVDLWSIGTILAELLLGHLPFQGQDSTQQHLVEVMKLLGTPSDRDLQAMRATCCADDLPKLKAYPWERMFPAHTPAEAVDLAQRLLKYDPDQRLTASQALAHPFFDGVETLLDCSSPSSSSMPPPPPSLSPDGSRTVRSTQEWERRVHELFSERGAFLHEKIADAVIADLPPVPSAVCAGVISAVRHELSQALRKRDEPMCELQQRLVQEAQKYRLPYEGQAAAANGGGSGSSADGSVAEIARLSQQVTDTKESHRVLAEALAEKAEVAARIRAAQMQLEGAAAFRAGSTDGAREEAAVQTEASEESKCPPGYGRRAPPMPTRQGTTEAAVNGRLSPMAANKPMQLQTDHLGQVTPIASYSSGSEGVSPGAVQMRAGSAGGRRRSRLSEKQEDGYTAEGET